MIIDLRHRNSDCEIRGAEALRDMRMLRPEGLLSDTTGALVEWPSLGVLALNRVETIDLNQ